jgi:hypothetical protein
VRDTTRECADLPYGVSYGCWRVSAVSEMRRSGRACTGAFRIRWPALRHDAAPREVFKANRTPGGPLQRSITD